MGNQAVYTDSIEERKKILDQAIGSLALEGIVPTERTLEVLNKLVEKKITSEEAVKLINNFD